VLNQEDKGDEVDLFISEIKERHDIPDNYDHDNNH
jgi:hypothetical protein